MHLRAGTGRTFKMEATAQQGEPRAHVGEAKAALQSATQVPQAAKDFVTGWLAERYGVSLGG